MMNFDDSGNLSGTLNIKNELYHDIHFHYHSKPIRGKNKKEMIMALQKKLSKLKGTVEQHMTYMT